MNKRKAVRVTDEAHALLAEKAEDYDIPQKEIASEAILMSVQGEYRDNEQRAHIEQLKFKALKFKQLAVFYVLLAGVSFGLLGFIVGLAVK